MVKLSNGRITLEIEPEHGTITEFVHEPLQIRLVQEVRLAENFRLLVPLPHWRGHYILGKEQTLTGLQISDDGTECRLKWQNLQSKEGRFAIEVYQIIHLDRDTVTFRLEIENNSPYEIEEVFNLALGGIANSSERDEWRLHYTNFGGQGQEWAFFKNFPGTYLGPAHPVWSRMYPGNLSMPWVDLYNSRSRKGVYIGNHDTQVRLSALWCQLFPGTTYGGSAREEVQSWPDPAVTNDTPVGLTLAWNNFPFIAPNTKWSGPSIVFHFHSGIWWTAADYFRDWYDQTYGKLDKSSSWLAQEDAWQSTIISYPEGTIGFRFKDLPAIARAAKGAGINVLQIDGWDQGGIDRDYPYYTPDPKLGSWEDLGQAIRACEELGVRVMLFSNLQWINLDTAWYKKELHRYAVRDPFGNVRGGMGWEYNTTLGLNGQTISRMIAANPSKVEFQNLIIEQLENVVRLGAPATQIDKVWVMSEIDYSPDNPAPRDAALPNGLLETLQKFSQRARASNPDFRIASELHWDRAVGIVDASYSRFFAADHLPTFEHTFPEYRQSCCITGDYDYGLVNNCLRFGHIINLEARCLHGTAKDVPLLAAYIKEALRIRRQLKDYIWNSKIVEPGMLTVDGPQEMFYSLHESHSNSHKYSLVLNHFQQEPLQAKISYPGPGGAKTAKLYRPYKEAEQVVLPAWLTVPPREFLIAVFD